MVLSGGGAKGVSHIGVIRALEENGIPIDYIAGTSMGAIIGGLYASGYSPDDMVRIINSEEFTRWTSGKLDPEYSYFFRKSQPDASWLSFKFKYDSVLQTQLPTNIVSPVRMDFAFQELFAEAAAASGYDFNNLMVPFRCVAADIHRNKPYILRKGDLGSAIRASMTFPFYFKPIRIDGKLLFDGGMYNNFPSDVALEDFYPDIIIGSKAAGDYEPPEEDDLKSQLSNMLMGETKFNLYCDASVLIEPKLKPVNVIDFSNTKAFIDSGYCAAVRAVPEIRQFVIEIVTKAMHDSIRANFNARKPEIFVNSVQINGLQSGQSLYVANAVLGQVNKKKNSLYYSDRQSLDRIKSGYFKVIGENKLTSAYPTFKYDSISRNYVFIIDAKYEKGLTADFGGCISSGGSNEIFLQLKYSIWRKSATTLRINGSFGRFYNSALAGGRIELPGTHPKYLEAEYTFNQFNYYQTHSFFFIDDSPSFLYENNSYFRFDAGFPVTFRGKFELGATFGRNRADYFQTNTATQEDVADRTRFDFYSPYILAEFSTLNRKQYSNQGSRLYTLLQFVSGLEKHTPGTTSVEQTEYSAYHNYFIIKFQYEQYFRPHKMYKPGLQFEFNVNSLSNFRNYVSTTLYMPVYAPVYEMQTLYQPEYRPTGFTALGFNNIFSLSKNIDFRFDSFLMLPFSKLFTNSSQKVYKTELFPELDYVLSGSFVFNTPIGPLSASVNFYDNDTPVSFYINLGYIIFNRSAF